MKYNSRLLVTIPWWMNDSLNYNHEENFRQLWNFSHHKSFTDASLTKKTEENALWVLTVSRISKYCYYFFVWQFTFHNSPHLDIAKFLRQRCSHWNCKTLCNIDRSYLVFLLSCFSGFSLPMYVFKKRTLQVKHCWTQRKQTIEAKRFCFVKRHCCTCRVFRVEFTKIPTYFHCLTTNFQLTNCNLTTVVPCHTAVTFQSITTNILGNHLGKNPWSLFYYR